MSLRSPQVRGKAESKHVHNFLQFCVHFNEQTHNKQTPVLQPCKNPSNNFNTTHQPQDRLSTLSCTKGTLEQDKTNGFIYIHINGKSTNVRFFFSFLSFTFLFSIFNQCKKHKATHTSSCLRRPYLLKCWLPFIQDAAPTLSHTLFSGEMLMPCTALQVIMENCALTNQLKDHSCLMIIRTLFATLKLLESVHLETQPLQSVL